MLHRHGASPRARGRPERGRAGAVLHRSIPAGAGSTSGEARAAGPGWEHPRGRGVDEQSDWQPHTDAGASPRARGRQEHENGRCKRRRSIPAGAGSTPSSAWWRSRPWEHPRGRGVDGSVRPKAAGSAGASPRARGRPSAALVRHVDLRSIPAGAGSTAPRPCRPAQSEEHPRGRGVDTSAMKVSMSPEGASPRARGRQGLGRRADPSHRSIPAGAGSTSRTTSHRHPSAEHPRGRGVDAGCPTRLRWSGGASPRARGRPGPALGGPGPERSIPAGAGSTSRCSTDHTRRTEHPRGRGVDASPPRITRDSDGASPRARGRRPSSPPRCPPPGSIPAGAGSTQRLVRCSRGPQEHPRGRGVDSDIDFDLWAHNGASPRARGRHLLTIAFAQWPSLFRSVASPR